MQENYSYKLVFSFNNPAASSDEFKNKNLFKKTFIGKSLLEKNRLKKNSVESKKSSITHTVSYEGIVQANKAPQDLHISILDEIKSSPGLEIYSSEWILLIEKDSDWPVVFHTSIS